MVAVIVVVIAITSASFVMAFVNVEWWAIGPENPSDIFMMA